MNQFIPKDPLETATIGGYTQMLKDAFGESLVEAAVYEMMDLPRGTLFNKGLYIDRWVLQKFKVGGIDSQLYALHQGMTQGMRNDKGIFWLTHLGSIFDFGVPKGFFIRKDKNLEIFPLRSSGHKDGVESTSPLQALLQEELDNQKQSKFASNAHNLPWENKYQMSGLNALTMETKKNATLHVIPRHGKTIVTVNFLSYIPNKKKTKGYQIPIPVAGKDKKHEIGTTYPPNLANAYHLMRSIQDIPDFMKSEIEVISEIPRWPDEWQKQGADNGGLSSFLALELARQVFDPDREPLTLVEYITRHASLNSVIQPLAEKYGDIAHVYETKNK